MYNQVNFSNLKACTYNRKSSENEDRQVLSIISQIEESEKIACSYGLQKFVEVFEESKSAKKEFLRPEFSRMLNMIKSGHIDSIVCWKLDRLARNMTEGGIIIDLLSSGILKAIITHEKAYFPSDNVLMMSVEFGQGKQFVKDLSINVKRGQTKKAKMGLPHGLASLGFINDRSEEKGNRKWKVDKERLLKIKKLFEEYLTGLYSAGKLYKYAVDELKLTTVKRKRIGGNLITSSRIYEILKDPVYAGFFYYGGEEYELDKSLPRLITVAERNKVLALLNQKNIPKTQTHTGLYTGFLRSEEDDFIGHDYKYQVICDCKYKFAFRNKTHCPKCNIEIEQMENPKYIFKCYYYNVRRKKQGLLYKSIEESSITEKIKKYFDDYLTFSESLLSWSKHHIQEIKDNEIEEARDRSKEKEKSSMDFQKKKQRLRDLLLNEVITEEEFKSDMTKIKSEYEISINDKDVDWFSELMNIIGIIEDHKKIVENGTNDAKRRFLSELGSNLIWDGKNLCILSKNSINKLVECIRGIKKKFPKFEPKNYQVPQGSNEKNQAFDPIFSTMLRTWEEVRKEVILDKSSKRYKPKGSYMINRNKRKYGIW